MTCSMTAFARVQTQVETAVLCWEIKSVNHRYLEASFRLPEAYRYLEPVCRSLLKDYVNRGKLDCQLKINWVSESSQSLSLNEPLIQGLLEAGKQLSANHHIPDDLSVSQILAWPGAVQTTQPDQDEVGQTIKTLFQESMNDLVKVRETEGQKLNQFVMTRLQQLAAEVEGAKSCVAQVSKLAREKLLTRLEGLQLSVTESRIEQEIALMLARLDVSEELDRLQAHIEEVTRVIKQNGACGRRLDFLMQELNREANTLSSKSDSSELTRHAVEMKVLIEQMREQIQNIE